MNIRIKFSYLLQIISDEEGKRRLEGINFKIFKFNGHQLAMELGQSLRLLLV